MVALGPHDSRLVAREAGKVTIRPFWFMWEAGFERCKQTLDKGGCRHGQEKHKKR